MSKKNRHFPADKKTSAETAPLASTPKPSPFHLIFLSLVLILSVVIVYQPSLKVPFLLDDYGKIIRNPDIKSLSNIPSRLIYPYTSQFEFHRNDPSRPLTYLTLTLNYHFNHLDPYGYHVVNIALHMIVVLLVFFLGFMVFPKLGMIGLAPPFLSALLFAVHPINVNVVTYIMGGRPSLLAAMFYLFSVILFIRSREGLKWAKTGSVICFVLGLMSNQLALTLPAIIIITDLLLFRESEILRNWKRHVAYWGVAILYLGFRVVYFGQLGDVEASALQYGRYQYFLTETVVLWKYINLIMWPTNLSFEHLFGPLNQFLDSRVLGAIALYGILAIGLIKVKSGPGARFLLFCLLWFFIAISPTSSVFPTTATMAENRVYLPAIGLFLMISFLTAGLLKHFCSGGSQNAALLALAVVSGWGLGILAYRRNVLYQEPIGIWADVIERYPTHQRANKNLGVEYLKAGRVGEAIAPLEKAMTLNPKDFDAVNNLAAAYYDLRRYEDALVTYQEIVKRAPNHAAAHSNLGLVYDQLKNKEAAIDSYERALEITPNLIEPMNNLGAIYLELGRLAEAAHMFEAALKVDPNNKVILQNLNRAHHSGSR